MARPLSELSPSRNFTALGRRLRPKWRRLGILTGADLKAQSLAFLQQHFGKSGAWYYNIARGIDHRLVQPDRPRKSVGVEDTFTVDIFDREATRAEITPLAAEVWRRSEGKGPPWPHGDAEGDICRFPENLQPNIDRTVCGGR